MKSVVTIVAKINLTTLNKQTKANQPRQISKKKKIEKESLERFEEIRLLVSVEN